MTTKRNEEFAKRTPLPDGWPEQYSAAGRSPACPHQMHWDDADGVYRCIHERCGEVDVEPPGGYIDDGAGQDV